MLDAPDTFGCTPLFYATTVQMAAILVYRGANVNHKALYGYTALHHFAFRGRVNGGSEQPAMVDFLLDHDADVGAVAGEGLGTPLEYVLPFATRYDAWEGVQKMQAKVV